jgi:hypothetical protein
MLDEFLEHPFFLNRHRQAPLLKERASFLNHLQQQGTSRKALRNLSAELLQVVRLLKLTEMREISLEGAKRCRVVRILKLWGREVGPKICYGIALKKQEVRPLMERFGATEKVPSIAKPLKEMVGTRRLELLTSTVSKILSEVIH